MDLNNLDSEVQQFTQAIATQEGGGKLLPYDAKSGDDPAFVGGRYQFRPATWKNYAKEVLGDENSPLSDVNQNKVAYTKFKGWKDKGYTYAQMASMWNAGSGEPDAYKGTFSNGKPSKTDKFDVPGYAQSVQKYAQEIAGQQTGNTNTASVANAQPNTGNGFVTPPTYVSTADAAGTEKPKTIVQEGVGWAGKALDFLFPVVGDISNLAQGKNEKSGLQLLGDTAMSVLPFIPGLGEAGLAAKGAKAASLASKGAKTAQSAGLLSKAAANPFVRNTAVGYGMGSAQNLSQGQGLGEALTPNATNLIGAGFGAASPLAGRALSGLVKKAAGVSPLMENALKDVKNVGQYDRYAQAAKERSANVRAPSVQNLAADDMEGAAKILKNKIQTAGEKVGQAKKNYGTQKLSDVTPVLKNFAQGIEDKFGMKVTVGKNGTIKLDKIPGRMKDVLTTADEGRIKTALGQLIKLAKKEGNVQKASDVIDNLDSLVDYSKKDLLGNSNDPLEGFFKSTRHDLNGVIGQSSPELAAAKTRYSELRDAEKLIADMAGKKLQRGELLMRRVFTGDMGADVIKLFESIKKETGVDLVDSAVLAKYMTESMGTKADKTALQQMIEGAAEAHSGGLINSLLNMGGSVLRKTVANPETVGRSLVQGKSSLLPGYLSESKISKTGLIGARALGSIGGL